MGLAPNLGKQQVKGTLLPESVSGTPHSLNAHFPTPLRAGGFGVASPGSLAHERGSTGYPFLSGKGKHLIDFLTWGTRRGQTYSIRALQTTCYCSGPRAAKPPPVPSRRNAGTRNDPERLFSRIEPRPLSELTRQNHYTNQERPMHHYPRNQGKSLLSCQFLAVVLAWVGFRWLSQMKPQAPYLVVTLRSIPLSFSFATILPPKPKALVSRKRPACI
ncbi:hypothetical protein JTE90_029019 [Oedothorax gibbosus]|uniref:Uncharacterized protein n=1 Tax=Oedothorax gibbosus TaxID=931172 RepID=A0AAV6TDZ7_9ARAC|nr:hypothetical protein JTE90_029019 [Oedothorax gibbosus]